MDPPSTRKTLNGSASSTPSFADLNILPQEIPFSTVSIRSALMMLDMIPFRILHHALPFSTDHVRFHSLPFYF
jgi:hypothetical protein